MSKKKNYKLQKNKFYMRKDQNGIHPSLVYGYIENGDEAKYKAVIFTKKKDHNSWRLKKSINKKTSPISCVRKIPEIREYGYFIDEKLKGYRVKLADRKLVKKVKKKK
ncbi:MAG: hypothetical protein K6E87_05230 [bacterium]|nr:hypothetical protein [bacterium]